MGTQFTHYYSQIDSRIYLDYRLLIIKNNNEYNKKIAVSICLLVGSVIINLTTEVTQVSSTEKTAYRYNNIFKTSFLQTSVDIGLVREKEITVNIKPLAVMIPVKRLGGQCLSYVQKLKNYKTEEFSGYPNRIEPNEFFAEIGYAVLTKEGRVGHIAIVKDIIGDNLILLESNYRSDEMITDDRILNVNSNLIRGYYNFDK